MSTETLTGQVALVTGATSGIGKASAIALGKAGAAVAVNHLPGSAEAGQAVVDEITKAGGRAIPVAGDVSDESSVERMFGRAIAELGSVHILVNNAGIQKDAPVVEMSLADWQKVIDVNLTGQFLCARAAAREFIRRGVQKDVSSAAGKIICMSSVHQAIPWSGHVNYASSKGGVHLLMTSLAQELSEHRIRVNAIAPGAIETRINVSAWKTEAARDKLLKLIPYGRVGMPGDIARAVVWLASDQSDYVTGTTLVVDGGMLLYPGFRDNG